MKALERIVWLIIICSCLMLGYTAARAEPPADQCNEGDWVVWGNPSILSLCRNGDFFVTELGEKFYCGKVMYL